jgi:glycosyltransferase involved in cell wall biosynthesis
MTVNPHRNESSSFRVSVIVPTYNSAAYIGRALESVLKQNRSADEIIVVDDGSTDQTGEIVRRYGDSVRYIRQENAGVSAARNTGIQAAQHDWIAFLDADDEWLDQHLALLLDLLERHRHLVWATGNFMRCQCRRHKRQPDIATDKADAVLKGREYMPNYFHAFLHHLSGHTITMLIKRTALEEAGLFRVGLPRLNDYDMWFRLAYLNPTLGYSSTPSAIYHLDVPDSIVKTQNDCSVICDILDRHFSLSAEYGCLDDFRPCAAIVLGCWMRDLLWEGRGEEIRYLLKRYKNLYSRYFKVTTYMSSLLPRTAVLYEKFKRRFRKYFN